ncbi:MAG: universal stress protein [Burkholderiaceae bacterium]|nr:universal stress protein [Burkholderiaceae bacterium]
MLLKDIFLYADSHPTYKARLESAVNLAAAHKAHLTGVYVPAVIPKGHPADDGHSPRATALLVEDTGNRSTEKRPQIASDVYDRVQAEADEAKDLFVRQCERAGVSGEWIYDEEPLLEALALNARFCDLLVISQPIAKDTTERLITTLELPVLVIPNKGHYPVIGQRILVAWDRSPVALRAINNALPLLRLAAEVKILSVNLESVYRGAAYGSGIVEHMARHSIKAERLRVDSKGASLSDAILDTAKKEKSDLIVMGAYGKRGGLRERLLGGVTSNVVADASVPLLLTH